MEYTDLNLDHNAMLARFVECRVHLFKSFQLCNLCVAANGYMLTTSQFQTLLQERANNLTSRRYAITKTAAFVQPAQVELLLCHASIHNKDGN